MMADVGIHVCEALADFLEKSCGLELVPALANGLSVLLEQQAKLLERGTPASAQTWALQSKQSFDGALQSESLRTFIKATQTGHMAAASSIQTSAAASGL